MWKFLSGILGVAGGAIGLTGLCGVIAGIAGLFGSGWDPVFAPYVIGGGVFVLIVGMVLLLPLWSVSRRRKEAVGAYGFQGPRPERRGMAVGVAVLLLLLVAFVIPFSACPECGGYGRRWERGNPNGTKQYQECALCSHQGTVTLVRRWKHRHAPPVSPHGIPRD